METPVIKVDGKPFGEAIRILLDEFHQANAGTAKFVIDDAKIVARPRMGSSSSGSGVTSVVSG